MQRSKVTLKEGGIALSAQINLTAAHLAAREQFAGKDPVLMSRNARVDYEEGTASFLVPFLGRKYRVYHPEGKVELLDGGGDVPQPVQIVLLHYLSQAGPEMAEGRLISFKELPDGFIYREPFTNRAIRPLVAVFGQNPSKLIEAAEQLGGWKENLGDVSVTIPVFPKIPITFVIWEGDEEFPPSGNVLFDASAPCHLPTEDYALLPGLVIGEMKKRVKL